MPNSRTRKMNFIVYALLLSIWMRGCCGKFRTRPQNTVVVAGSQAVVNCSTDTDRRPKWHHGSKVIYSGYDVDNEQDKVVVNSPDGTFDLIIKAAKQSDAGTYSCYFSAAEDSSAELVVLDSRPLCNISDDERVHLECVVHYHGNLNLTLEWELVSQNGSTTVLKGHQNNSEDEQGKSVYSSLGLPMSQKHDGGAVRSKVCFNVEDNQQSKILAKNVPHCGFATVIKLDSPNYDGVGEKPSVVHVVVGCLVGFLLVVAAAVAAVIIFRKYECECVVQNTPDIIASNSTDGRMDETNERPEYASVSVRNFSIGHPDSEQSVITLEIPDVNRRENVHLAGPMYAEMCSVRSNRSPRPPRRRNEQLEMYAEINHRMNAQYSEH